MRERGRLIQFRLAKNFCEGGRCQARGLDFVSRTLVGDFCFAEEIIRFLEFLFVERKSGVEEVGDGANFHNGVLFGLEWE